MVIDMNETKLTTICQIREFLAGTAYIQWASEKEDSPLCVYPQCAVALQLLTAQAP